MKSYCGLLCILGIVAAVSGQVLTDFDADSLEGWRSEGDGDYILEPGMGNPGNCMRVNDDATGDLNIAIAPIQYLGDWSAADTLDSIMTDVYVNQSGGTIIPNTWVFRISGPGGNASSNPITISAGEWTHISVPFDSTAWTIASGDWNGVLGYVNHMEVRAEYINGDEFVRLDNIGLTFSPVVKPIVPLVLSDFESGSYDGWTFEYSGGISLQAGDIKNGRYIRIADGTGLTQAIAPPKFLGDWSHLDNQAMILFDLNISSHNGPLMISDFLLKISGSGGTAFMPMDSAVSKAYNQWQTLGNIISERNFTILSGSWNAILEDVREVRIVVEYIDGSEVVLFDNFRISSDKPIADFTADPLFLFLGDQTEFTDHSANLPDSWQWDFGDGEMSSEQNPVHEYMNSGMYGVQLIAQNQFGTDTLLMGDYIEVKGITDSILFEDDFDDNQIHPAWKFRNGTWSEQGQNIRQTSNYYGNGYIEARYALVGSQQWKNYALQVDFSSSDDDKIGVVFKYQDAGNFYLFTWQTQGAIRMIKRFEDGVDTTIAIDSVGYIQNQWYQLDVRTMDGQIDLYLDSTLIFAVFDTTFLEGKAGLYCHGNQNGYWDNFKITNLDYVPTYIPNQQESMVREYNLEQNFPNPFNNSTMIRYNLTELGVVELSIYNMLGQKIIGLIDENQTPGTHQVLWNADGLPSGIYLYRLKTKGYTQTRKMILLQ